MTHPMEVEALSLRVYKLRELLSVPLTFRFSNVLSLQRESVKPLQYSSYLGMMLPVST